MIAAAAATTFDFSLTSNSVTPDYATSQKVNLSELLEHNSRFRY